MEPVLWSFNCWYHLP